MGKKKVRRPRRRVAQAQRAVNRLQALGVAKIVLLVALAVSLLAVGIWRLTAHQAPAGVVASAMGTEFSLLVANRSGIRFGMLQPLSEAEDLAGWRQTKAEKTELAALSKEELVRRLLAIKPERTVLKQHFSQMFWDNDVSPLTRTENEIVLIPQIHGRGGVALNSGSDPGQYAMACQTEIARFLLRQRQRGRFALVIEGHTTPMVTSDSLISEMRKYGESDWDKTVVAYCGATMFGLNNPDCPMGSEGPIAEVTEKLWGGRQPQEVEEDPVFEIYNSYRDRVFAAAAVSLGSYNKLPVFVIAGGDHMNGIQYQLERWEHKCRAWVPLAYREYVGGRP